MTIKSLPIALGASMIALTACDEMQTQSQSAETQTEQRLVNDTTWQTFVFQDNVNAGSFANGRQPDEILKINYTIRCYDTKDKSATARFNEARAYVEANFTEPPTKLGDTPAGRAEWRRNVNNAIVPMFDCEVFLMHIIHSDGNY